ncbi:Peptidase C11 clostripain [Neorhizobium galegae bv. orientalis]|nr:Peptidase C11 clostripain [Neorhizobium galegae bv. orientalis]
MARTVLAIGFIWLLGSICAAAATTSEAEWTIFVYMNADNNLEPEAIKNINQMEIVGSSEAINIIAQVRRSPKYDLSNGDWDTTRRFRIVKDDDPLTITSEPVPWPCDGNCVPRVDSDVDLGRADVLVDAAIWAFKTYPARRYALIIWGHGRGWRGEDDGAAFKGLEKSERSDVRITTAELGSSAARIKEAVGRQLNLIIFDSCSMGMIEIAREVAESAKIMVASQDIVPPEGIPYDRILKQLDLDPKVDEVELAKIVVGLYAEYYATITSTMSAVYLSGIAAVVRQLDELGSSLQSDPAIASELQAAYNLAQKFRYVDYVDLDHFLQNLLEVNNQNFGQQIANLRTSLSTSIFSNVKSGAVNKNASGLSAYLPARHMYDSSYEKTGLAQAAPGWLALLRQYGSPTPKELVTELVRLQLGSPVLLGLSQERYDAELKKITLDLNNVTQSASLKNKEELTNILERKLAPTFQLNTMGIGALQGDQQ